MMKRGRGGARPGAGRISDRSKDLATHYTTEAVPESASKRLKCKHCDWHEQGVKLDRFEGHMRTGKKSVESFRNHCVIEQKITQNHTLLLIFVLFSVQSRNDF